MTAAGVALGDEQVAADTTGRADLKPGQERGVSDELTQPGGLVCWPAGDLRFRQLDEVLDRYRRADDEPIVGGRQSVQLGDVGDVDQAARDLVRVDGEGSVTDDRPDLLPAERSGRRGLDPHGLRECDRPEPVGTAGCEVEPFWASSGCVDGHSRSPQSDREGRVHFTRRTFTDGPVGGERADPFEDGPVSGAAAQVAAEQVLDVLPARGRVVPEVGVRGHDEPRRAEPTLSAVVQGDAVLDRVEALGRVAQPFDGDNVVAGD